MAQAGSSIRGGRPLGKNDTVQRKPKLMGQGYQLSPEVKRARNTQKNMQERYAKRAEGKTEDQQAAIRERMSKRLIDRGLVDKNGPMAGYFGEKVNYTGKSLEHPIFNEGPMTQQIDQNRGMMDAYKNLMSAGGGAGRGFMPITDGGVTPNQVVTNRRQIKKAQNVPGGPRTAQNNFSMSAQKPLGFGGY